MEIKSLLIPAITTVLGALIGSVTTYQTVKIESGASLEIATMGAEAALSKAEHVSGSEWDLVRTKSVLSSARTDFEKNSETDYAAWVCYHSIIWDCANKEWSITNEGNERLAKICPPLSAKQLSGKPCPVRK